MEIRQSALSDTLIIALTAPFIPKSSTPLLYLL